MNHVFAAASAALGLMACASGASAHSWYTYKVDPVYGTPCCGGSDCGQMVINSSTLTAEAQGYHIHLTLDETRQINPYSVAPVDALVTWDRVQASEDGNYHICLMTYHRDGPRGGIYCLFAPPNT